MKKSSLGIIAVTAIVLLACSSLTSLQASLLDTPSPYWSQNHPLGRNPARAAYLKEQNRLNASYTLGTQINYTEDLLLSIENPNWYYKRYESEVPAPYTNTFFSTAFPLFTDNLYLGLVYNNVAQSRRLDIVPSTNVPDPGVVRLKDYEDNNFSEIESGIALSFPVLNNKIYIGIEGLQKTELFENYSYEDFYEFDGTSSISAYDRFTTTIQSDPYNVYTLGALFPLRPITLALSHTITNPKHLILTDKSRYPQDPDFNVDTDEEFINYDPPITGLGVLFSPTQTFEVGLGAEFFGTGEIYDYSHSEQNYMRTKPFTRFCFAIETKPVPFFSFRTFGNVTKERDARLNKYDRELLEDNILHASTDEGGDFDNRYVFDQEEIGFDLEFTAAEKYSAVIGASKKNYIFPGNQGPYGISLAVEDFRTYFGLSIIGIFEGNAQPEQKKTKPVSTKFEKIPTADKKLPDRDTENAITPQEGTPNAYTTFKEEVYISAQNVFPGDNLIVTVKEGKAPLFKATVGYVVKKQEYRYALYQDDATKTWTATVPVSPLTPPGTYTVKLNKIYDDTSLEVSTFTVTVKALPKDQQ